MKAKANLTLGGVAYQFEIEEREEMETLHKIIVLTNPRKYCELCKATEGFKLDTNKDKEGNVYINVTCKCGAKSKLGQYKAGGYFWHEFKKFERKTDKSDTPLPPEYN